MSNEDATIGWRQLREFADVDLTKSFILSWSVEAGTLYVDVDLCLEPGHPFYETPRPAEKFCIRPALIEFPNCEDLQEGAVANSEVADIAGNLGVGVISDLTVLNDGRYAISGEFGTVSVNADRPILRLKGP